MTRLSPISNRVATVGWLLAGGALIAVALLPVATTLALWPRLLGVLLLGWWLPGALIVLHLRLPDLDLPMGVLLALGLGWCWCLLIALVLHWLPGPISRSMLLGSYAGADLLLLAGLAWRRSITRVFVPTPLSWWRNLALLLILAIGLRMPGLGYHEFHFDEVMVLTRAREAIRGEDDAFARHTKGPGELAMGVVIYRTLDTADEGTARFPFGVASVGSVLALAVLGRRLFDSTVGLWAGILFALNGFALGLSRIVQYQPAVLLLMALAVLTAWEFAERGDVRWLALAGIFSTFGLIMHYEFGLLAPVLLVLAWQGWRRTQATRAVTGTLAGVGLPCLALVAGAYVPIVRNPYFNQTQNYLSIRFGGLGTFNLGFFVEMATLYNSIYFFVGLLLLVGAGLVIGWRTARRRTVLLALWFAPFLILYLFIVQFPGTHFYLLMESWSVLAALPLAALTTGVMVAPLARAGTVALVTVWLAVSAGYLYLMFFRQSPEYLINYADVRVPFYWAPYGERAPEKPRFGFPILEGWNVLGVLAEWKYFGDTYASNERSRHVGWYLGEFQRDDFADFPEYIFVAQHLQQPHPDFHQGRLNGYHRVGDVYVRGEPRIAIWKREPLPVEYVRYDQEQFAPVFPGIVPSFDEWPDPPARVEDVPIHETTTLASAGMEPTAVEPGDTVHILLRWQPMQPLADDYKLFVHVGADSEGRPLTQWDGYPGLNTARTSTWPVGDIFHDHVLLTIPDDTPAGTHEVRVGLYDAQTGERLGNTAVLIGTLTIR